MKYLDLVEKGLVKEEDMQKPESFIYLYRGNFEIRLTKFLRFECVKCGGCCRENIIALTYRDIRRGDTYLQKNKKLRKYKGKWFYYKKMEFSNKKPLPSASRRYLKRVPAKPRVLGINQEISKHKCIFLTEDNLCLIYKARPDLCKEYPYGLLPTYENMIDKETHQIGYMFQGDICEGFTVGKPSLKGIDAVIESIQHTLEEIGNVFKTTAKLEDKILKIKLEDKNGEKNEINKGKNKGTEGETKEIFSKYFKDD